MALFACKTSSSGGYTADHPLTLKASSSGGVINSSGDVSTSGYIYMYTPLENGFTKVKITNLTSNGYTVTIAKNGQAGINVVADTEYEITTNDTIQVGASYRGNLSSAVKSFSCDVEFYN